jgi:hypothetical protein
VGTTAWRRRSLVSAVAVLGALVGFAFARLLLAPETHGEWVRIGSIQEVRAEGITSLPELPAYVVADPPRTPITLLAISPHLGEPITHCQSSGWFEDPAHGAMFDRLGNYILGPAPRGPDRLETLVRHGVVWVNPNEVALGPPRGSVMLPRPAGAFCSGMD